MEHKWPYVSNYWNTVPFNRGILQKQTAYYHIIILHGFPLNCHMQLQVSRETRHKKGDRPLGQPPPSNIGKTICSLCAHGLRVLRDGGHRHVLHGCCLTAEPEQRYLR